MDQNSKSEPLKYAIQQQQKYGIYMRNNDFSANSIKQKIQLFLKSDSITNLFKSNEENFKKYQKILVGEKVF